MSLSTHVLDTAHGRPAGGVRVTLARADGGTWIELAEIRTNDDGRIPSLLGASIDQAPATYRLRFDTGAYFGALGVATLYPYVDIIFGIADPTQHYHIPLLLTPHGYTTYRGS